MSIKFTESEVKALEKSPEALRILADWHSVQETMADAMGEEMFNQCAETHNKRKTLLRTEAIMIEESY